MSPPVPSVKDKNIRPFPPTSSFVNSIDWQSRVGVPLGIYSDPFPYEEMWSYKFHRTVIILHKWLQVVLQLLTAINLSKANKIRERIKLTYHEFEHEITSSFGYSIAVCLKHSALIRQAFTEETEDRLKLISVHGVAHKHQPLTPQPHQEVCRIKPTSEAWMYKRSSSQRNKMEGKKSIV